MTSEWKKTKWGEIAELKYGKALKNYKHEESRYPVYGTNGLIGTTETALCNHPGVIIGRKGAYRGVHYSAQPFHVIDTAFFLEAIDKNVFDYKWAYYYLTTVDINSMDSGSAIPSTSREDFYSIPVNLPPLPEQRAIAATLSCLDDKIELNNKINANMEAQAQAIFKSWFVDFEPFQAGEFVDSELGPIPKGWRVGAIADISNKIYSGGTPSTQNITYWNGKLPWLSSGETGNAYIIKTQKHITQEGVDNSSTKFAEKYSTVIASAGQGFTRGQTALLFLNTYVNQSVIVVKSLAEYQLFVFLSLYRRYDELRAISDANSIRGSLTTKMIANLSTIIPPQNIINEFNKITTSSFKLIEKSVRQSRTLATLRDAFLPKLMSGEIEVPVEVD